jgi:hypothetical protein
MKPVCVVKTAGERLKIGIVSNSFHKVLRFSKLEILFYNTNKCKLSSTLLCFKMKFQGSQAKYLLRLKMFKQFVWHYSDYRALVNTVMNLRVP